MLSPIHHLTIIHYPPGGGWTSEDIVEPTWPMVEQAIRRMDDVECAPHRETSPTPRER